MRERLTTLLLACGALLLFVSLFVRGEGLGTASAPAPTSAERGASGLLGAKRWLEGEGVRTLSLRERFDTLAQRRDPPAGGNLLIVTVPVQIPLRRSELTALKHWVEAGNTLLVLAALADRPEWAAGRYALGDLSALTGLDFALSTAATAQAAAPRSPGSPDALARALQDVRRLPQPMQLTLIANRPHPYLDGVSRAIALTDYRAPAWDVRVPRAGFVLALAHARETGAGVLWLRSLGAGTVLVSGFGSLFSNQTLGLADNARLLANLVSASVRPDGAVLFDDEHQGLGVAYDPGKFYRDPRLYQTLGVLVALWLAWVLGATRLRLPPRRLAAPREAELVRVTGLFLARVLREPAAARRMFEHFFRRVPGPVRTRPADPPWDWLEQHPRLQRADVRQLRDWYADAHAQRRVPLARLHNLIVRTERRLVA
jgi:hypothetical protein